MGTGKRTRKQFDRIGPEEPPRSWDAQRLEHVPMAVARDMTTDHDAFIPTSAPLNPRDDGDPFEHSEPDVRPKGKDTVWDNDDKRLMPLHAGEEEDDTQ